MSRGRQLVFSLAPALALLLLGECGARLAGAPDCSPVSPSAMGWETMLGDPRYLWKLEPGRVFESPLGTTRINAAGLRTRLLPSDPKGAAEKRVIVTGDSSVYGWGQPDGQTYAENLERLLNEGLRGVTVSVINLGVPGYSTEQTLRLLEDVGWAYQPDLIVVHNIFSDCNIDAFQDRSALTLADPGASLSQRALHSSRLYCAARSPWVDYQTRLNQEPNRVLMPGMPTGPNEAVRLEGLNSLVSLSRVPLDDYLENLDRLREQAGERGAQMVVAPLAQEWDVGLWRVPAAPPTDGRVLPWVPYREAQAEWAEEEGVGRVYLPEVFTRAAGSQPDRLFSDHIHPSVEGGLIMARAVAEHIRARPELLDLDARAMPPLSGGSPSPPSGGGQRPGGFTPGPAQPGTGGASTGGGAGGQRPPGLPPGTAPPQQGR